MGSPSPPPAPNYEPIAQASQDQANKEFQLGQDQLDWAKKQYADQQPYVQRVQAALSDSMENSNKYAADQQARYEKVYQPVEDKMVSDAMTWDSPERMAQNRARAAGVTGQAFDAADASATRELEGYGVDPTSARFGALNRGAKLQRAAAMASAENQSDVNTTGQAVSMRQGVVNTGRGYPTAVQGYTGTGTTAGSAGVGAGNQTASTYMPALGNPAAYYGLGNQGLSNAGNILTQGYGAQMAGYNASQNSSSGVGAALGMGLGLATKFLAKGGVVGPDASMVSPGPVPDGMPPQGVAPGVVPQAASVAPGQPGDTVPAMLQPDEFVVPKRAVLWFGQKHLQNLVQKADKEMSSTQPAGGPDVRPVPASTMERPTFVSQGARGVVPMRRAA